MPAPTAAAEPPPKPKPPPARSRSLKSGGMDDLFGAPTESRVRMGRRTKKTEPAEKDSKGDESS